MNHKQLREESERYIKSMREKLGGTHEARKAIPPTAPFNDDEYEALVMSQKEIQHDAMR